MRKNEAGPIVPKTWGFEVPFINGPYAAKFLYVLRDHYSSFHCHHKKDETFLLLSGEIALQWKSNETAFLKRGAVVHIPPSMWHSFKAVSGNAIILEVSTYDDPGDTERRMLSIEGLLCKAPQNIEEFFRDWMCRV